MQVLDAINFNVEFLEQIDDQVVAANPVFGNMYNRSGTPGAD
jgi:hypothetical protein